MHSKTRLNTETKAQPVPGLRLMAIERLVSMRELDYRFDNGTTGPALVGFGDQLYLGLCAGC